MVLILNVFRSDKKSLWFITNMDCLVTLYLVTLYLITEMQKLITDLTFYFSAIIYSFINLKCLIYVSCSLLLKKDGFPSIWTIKILSEVYGFFQIEKDIFSKFILFFLSVYVLHFCLWLLDYQLLYNWNKLVVCYDPLVNFRQIYAIS